MKNLLILLVIFLSSCGNEKQYINVLVPVDNDPSISPVICKVFEGLVALPGINDVNPTYVVGLSSINLGEEPNDNLPFSAFLGTKAESVTKNFAMSCELYYEVKQDGKHTFYLTSDDGSYMYINDLPVITNNGGSHGMQMRSTNRTLVRGIHKIRINYFQGSGPKGLTLTVQEPANPPVTL